SAARDLPDRPGRRRGSVRAHRRSRRCLDQGGGLQVRGELARQGGPAAGRTGVGARPLTSGEGAGSDSADEGRMRSAEEFEELRPLLFAIAYRILGSVAEAEDAVQETWLRWEATDAEPTSVKAYLSTV